MDRAPSDTDAQSVATPTSSPGGEGLPIHIPESLAPVVVVTIGSDRGPDGPAEPSGARAWREVSLKACNRYGADLKEAFHEGLRAGGRCIVVWLEEFGPWQPDVVALLRPIFTRRADLVLPGFSRDARRAGLRPLPAHYARLLLGVPSLFVTYGPLAVTRRALDLVSFEVNDDDFLFPLQLLAQSRHFGLEVAPVSLSPAQYEALRAAVGSKAPGVFRQVLCGIEFVAHRWGLRDSPRFQIPQMPYVSRWMISRDRTY